MSIPQQLELRPLISELDQELLLFLENLSEEDWHKKTILKQWNIKDIAVHLLDGNLRTLSMLRDNYYGEKPGHITSYSDLLDFLNKLNADWVQAMKRISPKVIIDLLKSSGKEYCNYLNTLNPNDNAVFAVAWAGESESKNWFHIAREYTEKWHHQQQIRHAMNDEKQLLKDKWFSPYLDTSMRALPYHYRNIPGQFGDVIQFNFTGDVSYSWYLIYTDSWQLHNSSDKRPDCEVWIKNEMAWKIFTKAISREDAIQNSTINGDRKLGEYIFNMIAVMA